MRAELRRSVGLACIGLLCGFALVVTLFGAGEILKRVSSADAPRPVAALPPAPEAKEAMAERRAEPAAGAARSESTVAAPEKPAAPPGTRAEPGGKGQPVEAPTFDIIRIEPNGDTVIAGRGAPNTTVELLRDGQPIGRALIDPSGQFAIVPPALPAGASEIALRSIGAGGPGRLSRETVAVVVAPGRDARPLIALTAPDKPTVLLSQPDPAPRPAPGARMAALEPDGAAAPKAKAPAAAKAASPGHADASAADGKSANGTPASARAPDLKPAGARAADAKPTGEAPADAKAADAKAADAKAADAKAADAKPADVKPAHKAATIVSVESEEGGRLYVTSQAPPGATVRLYLNDALVAPGSAGADGRVTFSIGRGVQPGDYRVRVDQVDPVTGSVKSRSEVPFAVPAGAPKVAARDKPAAPAQSPAGDSAAGAVLTPPSAIPPVAAPPADAAPVAAKLAASTRDAPAMAAREPEPEPKPDPTEPARAVFVPEISTTRIARGDNLWQISRRVYGKGVRYTVIFDANQPQIRDPDLIYPGQIFVLPASGAAAATEGDKRG